MTTAYIKYQQHTPNEIVAHGASGMVGIKIGQIHYLGTDPLCDG